MFFQMKSTSAFFQSTIIVRALVLACSVSLTSALFANENSQVDAFKKILSKVPAPEMPAKAAELVRKAPVNEQKPTAIAVVRAAVQKSPVSAPFVVSAVSRAVPAVAAVAAA